MAAVVAPPNVKSDGAAVDLAPPSMKPVEGAIPRPDGTAAAALVAAVAPNASPPAVELLTPSPNPVPCGAVPDKPG